MSRSLRSLVVTRSRTTSHPRPRPPAIPSCFRLWPKKPFSITPSFSICGRRGLQTAADSLAASSWNLESVEKTIFALSSGSGRAGVAIIRISGPRAFEVFERIMEPSDRPSPRLMTYRRLFSAKSAHGVQDEVDRCLAVFFQGPHSFTGEDVVELQCHGSLAVIAKITQTLNDLGFFLAEPGEFTRRAFYNGKMDLTEVEGLADLIAAETEQQRRQALFHMAGHVGEVYRNWTEIVALALARIEALIDFGEDELLDVEFSTKILPPITALRDEIANHLKSAPRGEIIRKGISVAIVGPPNAGKSSLLNLLAQRPAAIVSPIAGTTRDVVEVHLDIGGYPVSIADTAGILDRTQDVIELEGIKRARDRFLEAEVRMVVFDGSSKTFESSSIELVRTLSDARRRNVIVLLNKADLMSENKKLQALRQLVGALNVEASQVLMLSCSTSFGVPDLLVELQRRIEARVKSFSSGLGEAQISLVTRARHKKHLEETVEALNRFIDNPKRMEIAAEELRDAMACIGRITGRIDVEGLLDRIFKEFCIGK